STDTRREYGPESCRGQSRLQATDSARLRGQNKKAEAFRSRLCPPPLVFADLGGLLGDVAVRRVAAIAAQCEVFFLDRCNLVGAEGLALRHLDVEIVDAGRVQAEDLL